MDDLVMVEIPVSPEAAEALADDAKRARVGKLVSDVVCPADADTDPLAVLIGSIKAEARADGLTDEDIDAELAAYNAEHRL
jgi:hypothetical protein